ncbi:MAG: hypothetical protein V4671_29230 [Armatimonadota bacterium]
MSSDAQTEIRREIRVRIDKRHPSEPLVRAFILERADLMALSVVEGADRTRDRFLRRFASSLLEERSARQRFPYSQEPGTVADRLYFAITEDMRREIDSVSLLEQFGDGSLEDPMFYSIRPKPDGWRVPVGSVITHEGAIELYVTSGELESLLESPFFAHY